MDRKIEELKARIETNSDVKSSAEDLVKGVADLLDGLTHDPVAIKAMADDLRKGAPGLGDAVCSTPAVSAKPKHHK